jgi:hypothetical protein
MPAASNGYPPIRDDQLGKLICLRHGIRPITPDLNPLLNSLILGVSACKLHDPLRLLQITNLKEYDRDLEQSSDPEQARVEDVLWPHRRLRLACLLRDGTLVRREIVTWYGHLCQLRLEVSYRARRVVREAVRGDVWRVAEEDVPLLTGDVGRERGEDVCL